MLYSLSHATVSEMENFRENLVPAFLQETCPKITCRKENMHFEIKTVRII